MESVGTLEKDLNAVLRQKVLEWFNFIDRIQDEQNLKMSVLMMVHWCFSDGLKIVLQFEERDQSDSRKFSFSKYDDARD